MSTYQATAVTDVKAPAQQVYAMLADYRHGHPPILPKPYFSNLQVEQGGVGAGTIVTFQMHILGATQNYRAAITEPEPGRVLVETTLPSGPVTTFVVAPLADPQQCRVTITTEGTNPDGLVGSINNFITKLVLRRIYQAELALIAEHAAQYRAVGP